MKDVDVNFEYRFLVFSINCYLTNEIKLTWFRTKKSLVLAASLLLVLLPYKSHAQAYLHSTGFPSFSVIQPVEGGSIDLSNGNLHVEIPVGTYKQRGGSILRQSFTYDSRIWQITTNGSSQAWGQDTSAGWHIQLGFSNQDVTMDNTSVPCGSGSYTLYNNYRWTDEHRTAHFFPISIAANIPTGCTPPANVLTGYATDSSGFFISANAATPTIPNVFYPNGTTFTPANDFDNTAKITDPNGNQLRLDTASAILTDTLGRQPNYSFFAQNPAFSEPNSQGGTSTYQPTQEIVPATTAFGQSGVTEFSGSVSTFQSISLPDGSSYQFQYDTYGELSGVTLPTGGTVTFGYSNFTDAYGNVNRWVTSYTMSGGTWTFTPQVITTCPSGQQNCQQKVTVAKPSGDSVVYTFTMNGGAWPVQVQHFASGGTLLLSQTRDYDLSQTCSGCTGAAYVTLTRETNSLPSTGGTTLISKTEYTYDSVFHGNVTAIKEWKFYTGTPSASPDRETDIGYLNTTPYTNANIINRPNSITTKDATGTQVAQTLITYDSTALTSITGTRQHDDTNYGTGNTVRGNPTLFKRWVTGTTFLSTTLIYDTTGQLIQRTDPAGNSISFGYTDRFFNDNGANPPASFTPTTPTNAYMTSAALPLIGTATAGYYFGSGNLAEATDQNNAISYSHYLDPFDRSTLALDPTGGWTLTSYPSTTETDVYTALTDATPSTSCVNCRHDSFVRDNVGRLNSSALINDPDGQINVLRGYDTSSRINSATNPYRTTTESTYGTTSPTYDGLNRIIQVTRPDGNIASTSFAAAVVSATQLCGNGIAAPTVDTDEVGKKRQFWTDGFGQVIEVDEPDTSGSFSIATCSQYDALGNLTSVTQRGGTTDTTKWRTRNYAFDGISRLTQATTSEGGAITYSYTTSGSALCAGDSSSVCRRTDARNITTTYAYDALSRLTSKTYSDTTPAVTYSYDQTTFNGLTITNGKGRRTGMTDVSGQTAWSYDAKGRVLVRQQKIGTITKSITYTYNLNGSVNTVTYPSGRVYTYAYNNSLRPVSVIDTAHNLKLASSAHYAAAGMLTSAIHGAVPGWNAITLADSFNNRLQPTQFLATSPVPSTLLNISFGYDQGSGKNNGNVVQIANGRDSTRSVSYTYDQLNRLSSAQTYQATTWGNSYVYDAWGNLLQKNVTQGTAESMTLVVNNKNQVTSPAFTYDAAGNTTWDTTNALKYDAEGRMNPVSGTSYTYDGDGRRVQKSDGTVYWLDDNLEPLSVGTNTGSITRDYVFFAGKRIATVQISSGNAYYYLSDQIGSTAVIASGDGKAIQWEADYFPFGSERTVITNLIDNHYQFTGDEYDFETAYNYAVERYQAGRWGRFLSPDILGGSLLNPQSLNRYAYVLNNPCTLIDPLGLTPQCTFNVRGGTNLPQATLDEIARILGQADVGVNFSNGSFGPGSQFSATLFQNQDLSQSDARFGSVENGSILTDNSDIALSAFEFGGSYDIGLGRVIAHELGHVLGEPQSDQPGAATNLMSSHDESGKDTVTPDDAANFNLTSAQKSGLLAQCKKQPGARSNGGGGGGGGDGGGIGPRPDPGDLILLLMADPGDGLTPHVTHRILPP